MARANNNLVVPLSFFLTFFVIIPTLFANIAEFDDYWLKRQEASGAQLTSPPFSNPNHVIDELNFHTAKALVAHNNATRRNLKEVGGGCVATNPIDRCWRCDPNWEQNRKRLADCALGFGRNTTGGKNGPIYVVTDPSDNSLTNPTPGTLRHAVTRNGPLWIIFKQSMVIRLQEELIMTGDKTIDGRGANVQIRNGAGFMLQFINNVIIHNIHVHTIHPGKGGMIISSEDHIGQRTKSDGDGISIFGSSNVWIDHVSMSKCTDGIIDAIMGSTGITVSNSHFTDHDEVMLFGASESHTQDVKMQFTLAFNHFGKRLIQRMPRVRYGLAHVVNNDYTHWEMYAIGGNCNPTIISQGNRFIASGRRFSKEITKREYTDEPIWKNWVWKSENDLMLEGAFFIESGAPRSPTLIPGENSIPVQSGADVPILTRYAGHLGCTPRVPC